MSSLISCKLSEAKANPYEFSGVAQSIKNEGEIGPREELELVVLLRCRCCEGVRSLFSTPCELF